MSLEEHADTFAAQAHFEQRRKYTGSPYIEHPRAVRDLVSAVGAPDEVLAAALLHDTVEDCGVAPVELARRFGQEVTNLVLELTDVSRPEDGNRAARKAIDRRHSAGASYWGKTIKLADLIDNTRSIVANDADFARVYLKEKRLLLGLLRDAHPQMVALADETLREAEAQLDTPQPQATKGQGEKV